MADTKNTSELQTADLTQQELAEKQERANMQKSQNEAAMAYAKYYRDKDASLTEWRRLGETIENPQAGLFMGSDHELKKLGPGIYERAGGACRIQYGKDGMIRPLANDLEELGKRTVLFGSERLLFNKNYDQPTSAYAARFDQAWGEVINFAVMGRGSQVVPIHYTGQVGYAPLILMLELCKKKGVGVDIKDDNIQNFLAEMLAGGPDFLLTATTKRGREKQRAKNIAIAERIIALEKEVNANYAEKLKPFEEQQGYLRSKEQLEKNEKLPTDPEKRAAAIQDLLKDKDGKPLSTEEKTKVLEAQVQSLNERAEALANKKVEIASTLDANSDKLNAISSDPASNQADIERIKDVMTGPVATARNGLLDAMKVERTDIMERQGLVKAELDKLDVTVQLSADKLAPAPDVKDIHIPAAPPPPAPDISKLPPAPPVNPNLAPPPAADVVLPPPPAGVVGAPSADKLPPANKSLGPVQEMKKTLEAAGKKLTSFLDVEAKAATLKEKVHGMAETLEENHAKNPRP